MLKLVWFIPRPERDIQSAETLYQGQHVRRGMRQENLCAFRISRGLLPQPRSIQEMTGSAEPAVFRFSEGYWESFEDIEECYRSPNGLAALADGMLNATPRVPRGPLPVFVAEEQSFATEARLPFDIFRGAYADRQPAKLFLFVRLQAGAGPSFDDRYAALAEQVGHVARLGPHLLSRRLDLTVRLGQSVQWPSPEAERYDRIGEYYFPDEGALTAFVESALFQEIAGLCRELGEATLPVATEPQEVFFTTLGHQPLSEGWLAFAREAR